jgi:hypothetical protein
MVNPYFSSMEHEVERKFRRSEKRWRKLRSGLAFRGKCRNSSCDAFNDMIVINRGFGTFRINEEMVEAECPACGNNTDKVNN